MRKESACRCFSHNPAPRAALRFSEHPTTSHSVLSSFAPAFADAPTFAVPCEPRASPVPPTTSNISGSSAHASGVHSGCPGPRLSGLFGAVSGASAHRSSPALMVRACAYACVRFARFASARDDDCVGDERFESLNPSVGQRLCSPTRVVRCGADARCGAASITNGRGVNRARQELVAPRRRAVARSARGVLTRDPGTGKMKSTTLLQSYAANRGFTLRKRVADDI